MDKHFEKVERHLVLAMSIDGLLVLLIGAPIWVRVYTSTVEAFVAALWWWPWAAAVMVGLVIWYGICEDRELVALVAEAPRVIVYAVVLLLIFRKCATNRSVTFGRACSTEYGLLSLLFVPLINPQRRARSPSTIASTSGCTLCAASSVTLIVVIDKAFCRP